MADVDFRGGLKRGTVTNVTVDVTFPDGQKKSFQVDVGSNVGGILFDDGVVKDLVSTRAAEGDPDWAHGVALWEAADADWEHRPSFLVLPSVDVTRCGVGNCPAAKDGVCVDQGSCAR